MMNVDLKVVRFNQVVSIGGFADNVLDLDKRSFTKATLIDDGIVIETKYGDYFIPLYAVQFVQARHKLDWKAGDHMKSPKEQDELIRARKAVQDSINVEAAHEAAKAKKPADRIK